MGGWPGARLVSHKVQMCSCPRPGHLCSLTAPGAPCVPPSPIGSILPSQEQRPSAHPVPPGCTPLPQPQSAALQTGRESLCPTDLRGLRGISLPIWRKNETKAQEGRHCVLGAQSFLSTTLGGLRTSSPGGSGKPIKRPACDSRAGYRHLTPLLSQQPWAPTVASMLASGSAPRPDHQPWPIASACPPQLLPPSIRTLHPTGAVRSTPSLGCQAELWGLKGGGLCHASPDFPGPSAGSAHRSSDLPSRCQSVAGVDLSAGASQVGGGGQGLRSHTSSSQLCHLGLEDKELLPPRDLFTLASLGL